MSLIMLDKSLKLEKPLTQHCLGYNNPTLPRITWLPYPISEQLSLGSRHFQRYSSLAHHKRLIGCQ